MVMILERPGGFVGSFAAGSRIAGYRLEERIGQAGWRSYSGPVMKGCGWSRRSPRRWTPHTAPGCCTVT